MTEQTTDQRPTMDHFTKGAADDAALAMMKAKDRPAAMRRFRRFFGTGNVVPDMADETMGEIRRVQAQRQRDVRDELKLTRAARRKLVLSGRKHKTPTEP